MLNSGDKYLFLGIAVLVAWAVLLSSDALVKLLPEGAISGALEFLRTAANVATGVAAVLAFRLWRRPETARRQGDTAQELLRLSQKVETAALGTRDGAYEIHFDNKPFTLDEKLKAAERMLGDRSRSREQKELRLLLDELHTYTSRACLSA